MEHALAFAETGHLVLATLHANNANQALDRIIHFFPADRHDQGHFCKISRPYSITVHGAVVARRYVNRRHLILRQYSTGCL